MLDQWKALPTSQKLTLIAAAAVLIAALFGFTFPEAVGQAWANLMELGGG